MPDPSLIEEIRMDVKSILSNQEVVRSQLKDILGNGQPGRLKEVEDKVEDHERLKYKAIGWGIGFLAAVELLHVTFEAGLGKWFMK